VDELERLVRNLEAQPAVNGLVRILHGDSPRPAIPHQPVALAK
jgi:hypothetical protein